MEAKTSRTASGVGASLSSTNLLSGDDASASAAAAASTAPTTEAAVTTTPVVTPTSVLEAIKNQKEWAKAVAFESDGRIIAATVKPLEGEVECVVCVCVCHCGRCLCGCYAFGLMCGVSDCVCSAFLKLFDKREQTIGAGIILLSEQYDVHRCVFPSQPPPL